MPVLLFTLQSKLDDFFDSQFAFLFNNFGQTFFVGFRFQFGKICFVEKSFGRLALKTERFTRKEEIKMRNNRDMFGEETGFCFALTLVLLNFLIVAVGGIG